jgi:pyrrolidone-carboxylate peptidase
MHVIDVERLETKACFIHLPYLHDQAMKKYFDFPSLVERDDS